MDFRTPYPAKQWKQLSLTALWITLTSGFLWADTASTSLPHSGGTDNAPVQADQARAALSTACRPMTFERNEGQTDAEVRFLARGRGYALYLTSTEAVLSLRESHGKGPSGHRHSSSPGRRGSMGGP